MKKIKLVHWEEFQKMQDNNELDFDNYKYAIIEDGSLVVDHDTQVHVASNGFYPEYIEDIDKASSMFESREIPDGVAVVTKDGTVYYSKKRRKIKCKQKVKNI